MCSLRARRHLQTTDEKWRELVLLGRPRDRTKTESVQAILRGSARCFAHGDVVTLPARPQPSHPPRTSKQALSVVQQVLAEPTTLGKPGRWSVYAKRYGGRLEGGL